MSLTIIKKLSPAFIALSLAVVSLNTIRLAQTTKINRKPAVEQKTIKIKSLESNIAASLVAAYR